MLIQDILGKIHKGNILIKTDSSNNCWQIGQNIIFENLD